MKRPVVALLPIAIAIAGLACARSGAEEDRAARAPAARGDGLRLERVVAGLESPVHLASPPGDPRLFVVEQPGRIRIVRDGRLLERPFLDLSERVAWGGERGLLSVAFHPDYARNGFLFVNYTDEAGDTRIERYRASADPDRADPASARLLLTIDQPWANHNGGLTMFGPDGMLWIGTGDGGAAGDPGNRAQNPRELLGKMLRIDVNRGDPYGIPPDNPFADGRAGRPEVWAIGLRNPWRYDFDDGRIYVADVGQYAWEEVSVADTRAAGLDYGWRIREGRHRFKDGTSGVPGAQRVEPVLEYPHQDGCSITGGHVYRGRALPGLAGHYFYADYCSGWIRSFRYADGTAADARAWDLPNVGQISSFGEDARGEIYVLTDRGEVHRLAPRAAPGP